MNGKSLLALIAIGAMSLTLSLPTPASAETKAEAFCKQRYGAGSSYAKCVVAYEERRRNDAAGKKK